MSTPLVQQGLDVISHIGCGFSANVQLVRTKGQLMALKVFKPQQETLYENEKIIMRSLSLVPGVIQLRDENVNGCLMMDYAKKGNMLQYMQLGKLDESMARHYFEQIIQIIDRIHKKGIAHRDLKLENILLDEDFNLVLCDFGFASNFIDNQGRRIKINNFRGTLETAAPELYLQQPYHVVEADLFQIGVILFQMCSGISPFHSANIKHDPVYQLIYKKQITKFWTHHNLDFSPELKDLLLKLLAYNPNQRLSIPEIRQHSWMNQPKCPEIDIQQEMENRWNIITEHKPQI